LSLEDCAADRRRRIVFDAEQTRQALAHTMRRRRCLLRERQNICSTVPTGDD